MTRFNAVIDIRGVNPFVRVSAARARAIKPGWRRALPCLVRIIGKDEGKPTEAVATNLMPAGDGSFYLYLHGGMRQASGTAVGDRVRVEVWFDASYRNGPQHPMPGWFRQGLAANPVARRNWSALIPSRKKEILRTFARLVSLEARARNLERALHVLSGEPGRFLGRDWKNGS
jgi:hypothetical protein